VSDRDVQSWNTVFQQECVRETKSKLSIEAAQIFKQLSNWVHYLVEHMQVILMTSEPKQPFV